MEKFEKNSTYERSIYSKYDSVNKSNRSDDNHLESADNFRNNYSIYSIKSDGIIKKGKNLWDDVNLGGIPVDYDLENKYVYIDSSESHTLLIGSTGSKKSRLVAMPLVRILASAGESMMITDPKGEIYNRCAANLKKKGYKINVVNFREPTKSDGWNFLSFPYKLYKEGNIDKACELVNDAASSIVPILTYKDLFWDYSARDLFVGLTLLLFEICMCFNYPEHAVNVQNVMNLRTAILKGSCQYNDFQETEYWHFIENIDVIKNRLLGIFTLKADRTLSCILSTFDQHMSCFSISPQLTTLFSTTTFSFDNIGYEKSAVFIILPDEKTTFNKLANILIKQSYEHLLDIAYKKEKNNRFKKRINYILDEFSSLPKINDFPQMISASRSRNIRFHLVMQSKKQLSQKYENETETIQSNCGNWMFLYSKELELLREISDLGGRKNNELLIPLHKLQHLNKEKGECLLFSNRFYPYYAYLPDINEYDNNETLTVNFPNLANNNKPFDLINNFLTDYKNRIYKSEAKQNKTTSSDDLFDDNKKSKELYDIQKELEAKFDELYGPLTSNDDD